MPPRNPRKCRTLSARAETLPKNPVCLADEPVSGELVSGSEFPASRENAGNFSEFEPDQAKGVWLMR
jgi:hypothetical protein